MVLKRGQTIQLALRIGTKITNVKVYLLFTLHEKYRQN